MQPIPLFITVTLLCFAPRLADAQTVQQPVVGSFSVGTTVSVPDRGQAHLGSIGSAGDSRSTFGPFPAASGIGRFRSHSSVSTSVYIHDFAAMDEAVLNSPPATFGRSSHESRLHGRANHAWNVLEERRDAPRHSPESRATSTLQRPSDRAERSYQLGVRAEERGDVVVARLHYQVALKYGSQAAAERLQLLVADRK